jgi:hypothetical protein
MARNHSAISRVLIRGAKFAMSVDVVLIILHTTEKIRRDRATL